MIFRGHFRGAWARLYFFGAWGRSSNHTCMGSNGGTNGAWARSELNRAKQNLNLLNEKKCRDLASQDLINHALIQGRGITVNDAVRQLI